MTGSISQPQDAGILRLHGAAIGLALLCGLIVGLPHLRPDAPTAFLQGDEWKEAVNIEAVRTGNTGFSELYLWEHRDAPWPYPRSPYWVCGAAARLLGSTERLFIAADFVLPPVTFLLLYGILAGLGMKRLLAIWVVSVFVLHHSDLYSVLEPISRKGMLEVFHWYRQPIDQGSILSAGSYTIGRFPFPALSLPLVLGFLALLFPALGRGRLWAIAAAGATLAAVTYVRFFDWMILYPALAAALALLAWRREWISVRRLGAVVAIGLAASAPYWVPALGHASSPEMAATLEHNGLERTRALFPLPLRSVYPTGPLLVAALLAACPFVGIRTPARLAFVAAVLGFVPCLTFQGVTGWTVSPDHFYRDTILPFCTATAALVLWRFRRGWILLALTGSVLHAALLHWNYACGEAGHDLRAALAKIEPGAVIMTRDFPEAIKVLAPHLWTFQTAAPRSPVATRELLERYLIVRKMYGATREDILALFEGMHADLWGLVGGEVYAHYETPSGLHQGRMTGVHLPAEMKEEVLAGFDAIPDDPAERLAFIRRRFRVDYVLNEGVLERLPP